VVEADRRLEAGCGVSLLTWWFKVGCVSHAGRTVMVEVDHWLEWIPQSKWLVLHAPVKVEYVWYGLYGRCPSDAFNGRSSVSSCQTWLGGLTICNMHWHGRQSPTIGFEGTNILHLVLAFVQVLVELGSWLIIFGYKCIIMWSIPMIADEYHDKLLKQQSVKTESVSVHVRELL
jgi:hypothetical protein